MSRLIIIDGHAIAHRAYHSIPPLSSQGQSINAVYGFYSMMITAINTLKPDYLAVCVDAPGPNFRNEEFLGYRAQRKVPDENLISQLPILKSSLETAQIPVFSQTGFEADDLIACLTKKALKKIKKTKDGSKKHLISQITIITGDKDLMQLVGPRVELFVPVVGLSQTKIFKKDDVVEKLGVLPSQVIDLKALMGDASDGYPGVAGIGPKSAIDLLSKYQNLDNIYNHLDEIKPAVKDKLEKDKDNAYLSQKLATLINDIPLEFNLKATKWNDRMVISLISMFKAFNFKSLVLRLEKIYHLKPKKPDSNSNQSSLF